jgi:hypothetical protein
MLKPKELKFRPSDLVLLVYVAAVVRAFFWGLRGEMLAWVVTVFISATLVTIHSVFREEGLRPSEKDLSRRGLMLLLYTAPLVAVFLARAAFPDQNYDVLNYHLANMERGLRGWPFIPGDFFPTTVQVNPAADIASGICKFVFGFRLGHIINLAAVLWTMSIVERFLRESIRSSYLRYLSALVIVSTELILFLQSIYLVDLLALPLLMEAALLAADFHNLRRKKYSLIQIGAFLGVSLAFKLSNAAFVIPIAALAVYQAYLCARELNRVRWISGMIAAAIAPAAPFMIFMASETGSPVFPLYNWVFRSPYSTLEKIADPILGPKNVLQILLWPFWVYIYPERGSEFLGGDNPYGGRITLGFVFALVSLVAPKLSSQARLIGLATAVGIVLWSASSGNLRYALPAEVLGGMVMFAVLASFFDGPEPKPEKRKRWDLGLIALCFSVLFGMQLFTSYREALTLKRNSYQDKVQPTIFQNPTGYVKESTWILGDRHAEMFLSEDQKQTITRVNVWVNSFPTTVGLMASLKPEIPIISVTPFQASLENFDPLRTAAAIERFEDVKRMASGKRLYTIVYDSNLNEALTNLGRGGLRPVHAEAWQLPYFSQTTRLNVQVIELEALRSR